MSMGLVGVLGRKRGTEFSVDKASSGSLLSMIWETVKASVSASTEEKD